MSAPRASRRQVGRSRRHPGDLIVEQRKKARKIATPKGGVALANDVEMLFLGRRRQGDFANRDIGWADELGEIVFDPEAAA